MSEGNLKRQTCGWTSYAYIAGGLWTFENKTAHFFLF